MLRLFALLSCLGLCSATSGFHDDHQLVMDKGNLKITLGNTVDSALRTIESAHELNSKLQEEILPTCDVEIKATEKWVEEGAGIDNKDRNADKAALANALADRIKGLSAFLGKLKKMRKRLREHIIRINEAYQTKSEENQNALAAAKAASRATKGLVMLMLPAQEKDTEADAVEEALDDEATEQAAAAKDDVEAKKEDAEKSRLTTDDWKPTGKIEDGDAKPSDAAMFLELDVDGEARLPTEVEAAKKLGAIARRLYNQVITNMQMTKRDIEIERGTMGLFRDKLRAMILKREAKLKALKAQHKALQAAIAAGGSFAEDVWPLLSLHLKAFKNWRSTSPAAYKESERMELKIIDAIKTGKAATDSTDVPAGATGPAAKEEKAETAAAAAATGVAGSDVRFARAKEAVAAAADDDELHLVSMKESSAAEA